MKRLLLALPFIVLAACSSERISTLTSPGPDSALRSTGGNNNNDNDDGEQSSKTVGVSPDDMHGWAFYDDNNSGPCPVVADCRMVAGPGAPPLGNGSAEIAVNGPTARNYLGLYGRYNGVKFGTITALSYWTYRQSLDPNNMLAIALQFNVDYNLTDLNTAWQGRIVYEPYQTRATVVSNVWQSWNTMTGRGWWSSLPAAALAAYPNVVPCTQSNPCTWAELVAKYPNAGVHQVLGAVILKAGGGWSLFRGNIDALTIGVLGASRTYDFGPSDDSNGDH